MPSNETPSDSTSGEADSARKRAGQPTRHDDPPGSTQRFPASSLPEDMTPSEAAGQAPTAADLERLRLQLLQQPEVIQDREEFEEVVENSRLQAWQGPIPPPHILAGYNHADIITGPGAVMLQDLHDEHVHRRSMERMQTELAVELARADNHRADRAMLLLGCILASVLATIVVLAVVDQERVAIAVAIGSSFTAAMRILVPLFRQSK